MELAAGRIDPFVVAAQHVRNRKVSHGTVRALDQAINEFTRTGILLSGETGPLAIFSDGGNLREIAARLARFNHHVAALIDVDDETLADVAFTLCQMLSRAPDTLEERQRLLKESYPSIARRNLSAPVRYRNVSPAARCTLRSMG
jgi:hypothetical protein